MVSAFSIGKGKRDLNSSGRKQETPGPGKYDVQLVNKKKYPVVQFAKSTRPPLSQITDYPSSQKYEIHTFMGKEGPKFTISQKYYESKLDQMKPSIGSYDVPGDNTKYYKSPSYSLGFSPLKTKKQITEDQIKIVNETTPGPGYYNNKTNMITQKEEAINSQKKSQKKSNVQNHFKLITEKKSAIETFKANKTYSQFGFVVEKNSEDIYGKTNYKLQNKKKDVSLVDECKQIKYQYFQQKSELKKKLGQIPKIKVKPKKNQTVNIILDGPKWGFSRQIIQQKKII